MMDQSLFTELLEQCLEGSASDENQRKVTDAIETDSVLCEIAEQTLRMDAALHAQSASAELFTARIIQQIGHKGQSGQFARRMRNAVENEIRPKVRMRRRRWGQYILRSASAVIVLAAAWWVALHLFSPVSPPADICRLSEVQGDVIITDVSQTLTAAAGMSLKPGQACITGPQSLAVFKFKDTTRVQLESETHAVLQDTSTGKELDIRFGRAVCRIAPQPVGRPMVFTSPHTRVQVKGTELQLDVGLEQTLIAVISGTVIVESDDSHLVLEAGNQTVARTGHALSAVPIPVPDKPLTTVTSVFPHDPGAWVIRALPFPDTAEGTWDRLRNLTGDCVQHQGTWYLMYQGWVDNGTNGHFPLGRAIGLATSPDGISGWQYYPGNPIISFQGQAVAEAKGVLTFAFGRQSDGSLALIDGRLVGICGNYDGKNSTLQWVTSADGKKWDQRGETGISTAPAGSDDPNEVWAGSLLRYQDTWYCFYYGGGTSRSIGLATGPTPARLKPVSQEPLLRATEAWEGTAVQMPLVRRDAEGWFMVYASDFKKKNLGLARSDDLRTWHKTGQLLSGEGMCGSILATVPQSDGRLLWRIFLTHAGSFKAAEAAAGPAEHQQP